MSLKKLLVLSAAAFAAMGVTAAIAGGPDHMAMSAQPAFQNSVYVDGHLGYAQSNWNSFNSNVVMGVADSSLFAPTSHGKGGLAGGVDVGYTITQHIAVEGGWFHAPQVKGAVTALGTLVEPVDSTAKISSWFAYMAGRFTVPVMNDFDLFGKVGVAYRSLTQSIPTAISGVSDHGHYWSPLFATGLEYNWGQWRVGAQYTHLDGNSSVNYGNAFLGAPNAAPAVNMYTGFLGYTFNV